MKPWRTIPLLVAVAACGGARKLPAQPVAVALGECSDPSRDGVVSERPDLRSADRDLNADGTPERVVSDKRVCRDGNCQWNLFHREGPRCWRYLGTVAGQYLTVSTSPPGEFGELRALWRFSGARRYLLQTYAFASGGYRLEEAMVCTPKADDRIECAPEHSRAAASQP